MGKGRVGAAEAERLAARIGNAKYLARPYSGRRDGMSVAECVKLAAAQDRSISMASGTMTGRDPRITMLAVYRAMNALAVRGRTVEACTLLLMVPREIPEAQLRPFMRAAYAVAELSDVEIVRADTSEVTAHVTTYGHAGEDTLAEYPEAEYSVVMCGLAGAEETLLSYEEHRERLLAKYPQHFLKDIPSLMDTLDARGYCEVAARSGAVYAYACSDGGVYAGLYGMGERLRLGMRIDLPSIPISQKTIEICEELDIDPYRIGANGCVFFITAEPERLLTALYEAGAEAAVIGHLQEANARELHNGDEVRYLEPFRGI